jgi:hypothetical protein
MRKLIATLETAALTTVLLTASATVQGAQAVATNAVPKMGTQAGTVITASGTELLIRNAKGERVTMEVAPNVVYVHAKPVKLADIKAEKWATVRGIISEPARSIDTESIIIAETKPENAAWTVDAAKKIAVGYLKVMPGKVVLKAEGESYEVKVREGKTRILLTTQASSEAVKPGANVLASGGITAGKKVAKWIAVLPESEKQQLPPAATPSGAGDKKG